MLTQDIASHIRAEAAKALVGQEEPFTQLLIAMFSGGHVLLEGVPGTAKTLMAKTLAALLIAAAGLTVMATIGVLLPLPLLYALGED